MARTLFCNIGITFVVEPLHEEITNNHLQILGNLHVVNRDMNGRLRKFQR